MRFASLKKMDSLQEDFKNYFRQDSNKFTRKCHQKNHPKAFLLITVLTNQDLNSDMQESEILVVFVI